MGCIAGLRVLRHGRSSSDVKVLLELSPPQVPQRDGNRSVTPDLDVGLSVEVGLELLLESMTQAAIRPRAALTCVIVHLVR